MRTLVGQFLTADNEFIGQTVAQRTTASLLWNATSTANLTLSDTHRILPRIIAEPGARCALWMVDVRGGVLKKRRLLEGRVDNITGDNAPVGTVSVPVVDDFDLFGSTLAWQVPDAALSGQGAAEYWRMTAPTETRVKAAIAANATRLALPWDVEPSTGLGTSAALELRMHPLAEKILPPLIDARLQLTFGREGDRWKVGVREGHVFPRPITPQSGVLNRWSWVQHPATATRAVVGGRGDGVEREFALVVDEELEARMGVILEIFVEARSAEPGEDLAPYGRAKLAEHAAKSGLQAQLRESSWFRFAETYELGDRLPVKIGSLEFEDVITKVDITHDAANGFIAAPTIGLATSDPQQQLVDYVRDLALAVRDLERR